jgi:MAE_28990/MAE_18760-like HEPN
MVRDMTKPYTEQNLSDLFDEDLIWRRRELSDMKAAIGTADAAAKAVLLRAMITMSYAHWEGYVRTCANRYFEHLTMRQRPYSQFERQIYINSFLVRIDALHKGRTSLEARCKFVNDILDGASGTFKYVHQSLIDTKSNLNTDNIKEICIICSLDFAHFESKRIFIDQIILKRRNAIAHGQLEFIQEADMDSLVAEILALMVHFRTLLENKIYQKKYVA